MIALKWKETRWEKLLFVWGWAGTQREGRNKKSEFYYTVNTCELLKWKFTYLQWSCLNGKRIEDIFSTISSDFFSYAKIVVNFIHCSISELSKLLRPRNEKNRWVLAERPKFLFIETQTGVRKTVDALEIYANTRWHQIE